MANKLIKSGVEINHIPLGTNENKNNYGINIYVGQSYVTTLGLLTNVECAKLLEKKQGSYPDMMIYDTLGYSTWAYTGGGSPTYAINRVTGAISGAGTDSFDFVTNSDIAKKCVEWSFCRDGNYKVDFVKQATDGTWIFKRTNIINGSIIQFTVGKDGLVYQL